MQRYDDGRLQPIKNHPTPSFRRNYCLIPLSKAWDFSANNSNDHRPETMKCETFASLVPKLGCTSLDSDGALLTTSAAGEYYKLYLATHVDDLPPLVELTLQVFDATAIALSSTADWSAAEKAVVGAVVRPAISMYNSYANAVGYIEVMSGLRKRMRKLLSDDDNDASSADSIRWLSSPLVLPDGSIDQSSETLEPSAAEKIAAQSSLILVLARGTPSKDLEVAASVEVRLQPTDAKIPFSQPWLDDLERRLVRLFPFVNKGNNASSKSPLRPYLCNLCVGEPLRNLGVGRALCRVVEAIASQQWGYDHVYLHVDPSNDAARTLYEKEGYVDVGKRWSVMWAGGADEIGYYVKKMR